MTMTGCVQELTPIKGDKIKMAESVPNHLKRPSLCSFEMTLITGMDRLAILHPFQQYFSHIRMMHG